MSMFIVVQFTYIHVESYPFVSEITFVSSAYKMLSFGASPVMIC